VNSHDGKSDLEDSEPGDPVPAIAEGATQETGPESSVAAQRGRSAATEELFRLLVESVRDYAIFMLDAKGRIVTWNTGAERVNGYRAGEIMGRHFSTFYPTEDVTAGKCEMELEVAARDGRFEDEGWRVRKDGSLFWANVVISAARNEHGELVGFSKVTRDLTERKRAEEERAARLAAEQANRVKDQFLAVLGHELRNPLAPIVTALQLMKLRGDRSTLKEQQVIERQLGHLMRLVDDLLDVSRIVQGKIELKQQRLDLREVIARAIEISGPLVEQRRHHFDVVIPAVPLVVHGDEARLTQVFTNLLVNAAKYTEPGGRVVIAVEDGDEDITISVRDNGIGIDSALLPHVFDLWVQGYQGAERSRGGLGIGLTLVRTLVELHGGKVEARSDGTGRGSTFCVRLPRGEARHGDAPTATGVEHITRELRRILLVDDNEDALVLLGDALAAAGHDVRTALDPESALKIARTFRPEVAILDIGLPTMDGYQLASLLRNELGGAQISMIALTGYGQPSDRHRSAEAGFDAHFVKPVDVQSLSDAIARA
jgi:PAS domain S-box-containing protein